MKTRCKYSAIRCEKQLKEEKTYLNAKEVKKTLKKIDLEIRLTNEMGNNNEEKEWKMGKWQ